VSIIQSWEHPLQFLQHVCSKVLCFGPSLCSKCKDYFDWLQIYLEGLEICVFYFWIDCNFSIWFVLSLFQVFAQTSVSDNGVDILISTLRARPQERTFGISCVSFLHSVFNVQYWVSFSKTLAETKKYLNEERRVCYQMNWVKILPITSVEIVMCSLSHYLISGALLLCLQRVMCK